MTTTDDAIGENGVSLNALFSCLASEPRRHLLGAVSDRAPDSLTRRDLATQLASVQNETPQDQVTNEAFKQALITLNHTHLPKLDAAELIDRNTDRGTVTITDHPALQDAGIVDVIRTQDNVDDESLDALFAALADPRRRIILDVLSHQYQQIRTETLAREVVASEQDTSEREVTTEDAEQMLVSLYHVHLPQLSEAGLITYDAAEGTVAYDGHPVLRVPWMHSQLDDDFRTSLTGNSTAQEVGTIEGRENVVSYGQSLCDRADEELFLMFTTTGLLEAGCFTRIKQAVDRGVDVYLGTRDPTVREFIQEQAPEVTLWEPQMNWLNLPVEDGKVGRLVFADREAIMLGTLGEKDEDGVHEEQAAIAEGTENAFVVMLRQMLSSHLEQFDGQTEELEAELPF